MKSMKDPSRNKVETPPTGKVPSPVKGSSDQSSVMIALTALIAKEGTVSKAAGRQKDEGLIDFAAPRTQGERSEAEGCVGVFPFGAPFDPTVPDAPAPSRRLFGRAADPTPWPLEMPNTSDAAAPRRFRVTRFAALGLLAGAAAALMVGLSGAREELRAPAQGGLTQAARSIEMRLPRIEAPVAAIEVGTREAPKKKSTEDKEKDKKDGKKRHGARGDTQAAAKAPAKASEAAAPQAPSPRPAKPGDPCNGDLACAMHRATGN